MKDTYRESNSPLTALWRPVLSGMITGFSVILAVLVFMALVLSFGVIPVSAASIISSVAVAAGAFLGGLRAAKKLGKNGLLTGAFCGLLLFLLFTVISLIAFKASPSSATLVRLIVFVTAASIGGILGVGSAAKRKIV